MNKILVEVEEGKAIQSGMSNQEKRQRNRSEVCYVTERSLNLDVLSRTDIVVAKGKTYGSYG